MSLFIGEIILLMIMFSCVHALRYSEGYLMIVAD